MAWVKFHEELTKGAKRGIPRALRFILMELALLARPLRGRIELPAGMSDAAGICDLLGGDAREVRRALDVFTAGDDPVIVFISERDRRLAVLPSWSRWNSGGEEPGASTARSHRFREVRRQQNSTQEARPDSQDAGATIVAPASQRSGNGCATSPREEGDGDQKEISPGGVDQDPGTTARARAEPPAPPRRPSLVASGGRIPASAVARPPPGPDPDDRYRPAIGAPPERPAPEEPPRPAAQAPPTATTQAVLAALSAGGRALAPAATSLTAEHLATWANGDGNMGGRELADVLRGIEQVRVDETSRLADPAQLPLPEAALRGLLSKYVSRIRPGEAKREAEAEERRRARQRDPPVRKGVPRQGMSDEERRAMGELF